MRTLKFDELPDILDAEMIANYLGISYNSALSVIKRNIVYIKIGSHYRVTKDNLKKFLGGNSNLEVSLQK